MNVYQIWNPVKNTIIHARDVIFNEDEVFDGNLNCLQDDCLHIDLDELAQLLTSLDTSPKPDEVQNLEPNMPSSSDDNCIFVGNLGILDETIHENANQMADELDTQNS